MLVVDACRERCWLFVLLRHTVHAGPCWRVSVFLNRMRRTFVVDSVNCDGVAA